MAAPQPRLGSARVAELAASVCLATDLGMSFPWEHGLQATVAAMRLCDLLGLDQATRRNAYYVSLLAYSGCTADAVDGIPIFGGSVTDHFVPVIWGSKVQQIRGLVKAMPDSAAPPWVALGQVAARLPRAVRNQTRQQVTLCEVAEVLADRLGLPPDIHGQFYHLTERYDGTGVLARSRGDDIPLGLRIALVARDASYLQVVGGPAHVRAAMRQRAGNAHDPEVAEALIRNPSEVLAAPDEGSSWDAVLDLEPGPHLTLDEDELDRALAAMGDFADLVSPSLSGHSSGVALLAEQAARQLGMGYQDARVVRRAGLVQDIGRAAVRPRVWERRGALSPDEREQVRLHSYHTERILGRSPQLRELATLAGCHHERLDGSGYHKGLTAATLPVPARLLAAADMFRALTQPRPHRPAQTERTAARVLTEEAQAQRLDGDAVAAVLTAAGQSLSGPVPRPGGLTDRETQVVGLVARGLATKQVARALNISPKTADHHLQSAYRKIGVTSRAAVSLYAMEHGLVAWGELPMGGRPTPS